MKREEFPLLAAGSKDHSRFDRYLELILNGQETGSIRNTDYQEIKKYFSSLWEKSFNKIEDQFIYNISNPINIVEIKRFFSDLDYYGFQGMVKTIKKVEEANFSETIPAWFAIKTLCHECKPLADSLTLLKSCIVKGRKPSENPKQVNPNKIIKTCSCCFRSIATKHGNARMADHGYRRPGYGFQTKSCFGTNYPPLEYSNSGLVAIIEYIKKEIEKNKTKYIQLPETTLITIFIKNKLEIFKKEEISDDEWNNLIQKRKREIERELIAARRELKVYSEKLKEWKPEDENNYRDAAPAELMYQIKNGFFQRIYCDVDDRKDYPDIRHQKKIDEDNSPSL